MIPTSAAPTDIGNDGRGVTAPGCRVRQSKLHDSFQALSGIRLPTRSAIGADPMIGKAMPVKSFTQTINPLPEELTTGPLKPKNYSTEIRCSSADSIEPRICKRGHLMEAQNVYVNPRGHAECRMCRRRVKGRNETPAFGYIPPAARTHCPQGHPYSAENTRLHATRGHRICKICRREEDRRTRRNQFEQRVAAGIPAHQWQPFGGNVGRLTEDQVQTIAERLREGETLNQIVLDNPACSYQTLRAYRHNNARRWKPLARLADANRYNKRVEVLRARRLFASPLVMQNDGATAFNAICAATEDLPDFLRDDVRSAMFLAAAEGSLKPRDAARRVREFATAHNRQFSKFVPGGGGIMRSLDEQVYDDGPTRLVDTVTHGLWQ